MKKIILTIIAAIIVTSCNNNTQEKEVADKSLEKKEWQKITPKEITNNFVDILSKGLLLSSGVEGDMNTMTIGWGGFGMFWKRPTLTIYVNALRHTHKFIDKYEYFTVCNFDDEYQDKIVYMGTHSGKDVDKVKGSGLTVKYTELGTPYYDEANLVIECKIIYKDKIDKEQALEDVKQMYVDSPYHSMIIGEIVNVIKK